VSRGPDGTWPLVLGETTLRRFSDVHKEALEIPRELIDSLQETAVTRDSFDVAKTVTGVQGDVAVIGTVDHHDPFGSVVGYGVAALSSHLDVAVFADGVGGVEETPIDPRETLKNTVQNTSDLTGTCFHQFSPLLLDLTNARIEILTQKRPGVNKKTPLGVFFIISTHRQN
jgi:hypothetical protein